MTLKFIDQIVIGTRVFGIGEVADVDDNVARFAITSRAAVEHKQAVLTPAPSVREAVSNTAAAARKAVKR